MGIVQSIFGHQGYWDDTTVIFQNTCFYLNGPVQEAATFPTLRGVVGKPWHEVVRPAPPVSLARSTAPMLRHAPVRAVLPSRTPRSRQAVRRRRRPVRSRPGAKRAA